MKKGTIIFKKKIASFLVVLMCRNTMGAVVSDNDGSAFITKAEFDSLKNNFQAQIDQYNTSIDSKIDGAIASYLAGINIAKTSVEKFADIGGEKILVTNSKNIDNLKFGKVGLNWSVSIGILSSRPTQQNSAIGSVKMYRTGDNNYEAFVVSTVSNAAVFKYYDNELLIDTEANYVQLKSPRANLAAINEDDGLNDLALRWGGGPYGIAHKGKGMDTTWSDVAKWNVNFGDDNFMAVYFSGINWGWLYFGLDGQTLMNQMNVTTKVATKKPNEIKYIIDDNDDKSTIWVYDPQSYNKSLTIADSENYVTNDRTETNPGLAGIGGSLIITSNNIIYADDYDTTIYPQRHKIISKTKDLEWTENGIYNEKTSSSRTASDWVEFHLKTNEKNPSKLKNSNFRQTILDQYASYGFHGYITEGLPIGIFKGDTSLKFDIDTTDLEDDVNFAISDSAFNTDEISTIAKSSKISLTIDGAKQTNDYKLIDAGTHSIEIDVNVGTAIFVKIAYPRSENSKNRKYFTWPTEYTLTDNVS